MQQYYLVQLHIQRRFQLNRFTQSDNGGFSMIKLLFFIIFFFNTINAFAKHDLFHPNHDLFHPNIENVALDKASIVSVKSRVQRTYSNHELWYADYIYEGKIQANNLKFDVRFAGPIDGEVVILLHGFAQTSFSWRDQLAALGAAGYFAIAPTQRGYSPNARPKNIEEYELANLTQDIIAIADRLDADNFHIVGHDFGAILGWQLAASEPDRIRSLSVLSTPHLDAYNTELADDSSCQYQASSYFDLLISQTSEEFFLANEASKLRSLYNDEIDNIAIEEYVSLLSNKKALSAALNWYRANIKNRRFTTPKIGSISVPTLYMSGTEDSAFCYEVVERTNNFVTSSYHFKELKNIGHWIPEQASLLVTIEILQHIWSN